MRACRGNDGWSAARALRCAVLAALLITVRRAVLGALLVMLLPVSSAAAADRSKLVRYHGVHLLVPRSWPVFDLGRNPTVCVRFNRHAVYLGRPGRDQRCPAHAAGRTEAILVQPLVASTSQAGASTAPLAPSALSARLDDPQHGVVVTATWNRARGAVQRALGLRSPARLQTDAGTRARSAGGALGPRRGGGPRARASAVAAVPGAVFHGRGFDACAAPSQRRMSAWGASPYRAIGVYIGGTDMACSQPNLTSSWVARQGAAGWHLIPIYVGLQAPANSCGCRSIPTGRPAAEGRAEARDAIAQAQAIGLGTGNPIYFDMEAYPRGGSSTSTALRFLAAWTTQLHNAGYRSGVYSSGASGIADLVAQYGGRYTEPDDIWVADWNGRQTTIDPYLPSGEWTNRRVHQLSGDHNETYGGATLDIDGDYLNGETAASGPAPSPISTPPAAAPALTATPAPGGAIDLYPSWTGARGVTAWRVLAGLDATTLAPLGGSVRTTAALRIAERAAYSFFAVQAIGSSGQVLGTSATVNIPPHLAIFGFDQYVPTRGTASLPVGCYVRAGCQLQTTITAGRRTIATTGRQQLALGAGLVLFRLTARGQNLLQHARLRRLTVRVKTADASGLTVVRTLRLVSYRASGSMPRAVLVHSPQLSFLGLSEFASRTGDGGVPVACWMTRSCTARLNIIARGRTIASSRRQTVGLGEVEYLRFRLTRAGLSMLSRARGGQLAATATLSGTPGASARVALVLVR